LDITDVEYYVDHNQDYTFGEKRKPEEKARGKNVLTIGIYWHIRGIKLHCSARVYEPWVSFMSALILLPSTMQEAHGTKFRNTAKRFSCG
jgi:hypothetical protein